MGKKDKKDRVVVEGDGVRIHFKGEFEDGSKFSSRSDGGPLEYLVGKKMVLGGLDKGVVGMSEGQKKKVTMTPEEAFGEWVQDKVKQVKLSELGVEGTPEVGMTLQTYEEEATEDMPEKIVNARITEINGDFLTLDYNHPLAGKELTLTIELIDIL